MAIGSLGEGYSTMLRTAMVNTKGSFVEQAGEVVVAFSLVKTF